LIQTKESCWLSIRTGRLRRLRKTEKTSNISLKQHTGNIGRDCFRSHWVWRLETKAHITWHIVRTRTRLERSATWVSVGREALNRMKALVNSRATQLHPTARMTTKSRFISTWLIRRCVRRLDHWKTSHSFQAARKPIQSPPHGVMKSRVPQLRYPTRLFLVSTTGTLQSHFLSSKKSDMCPILMREIRICNGKKWKTSWTRC